jgi:hypothetical protein
LFKAPALLTIVLATALGHAAQTANHTHTITLTFDYDFRITPACSSKITKDCVQQFVAYDISAGIPNRTKLISIPVPPGASGLVKGITATIPPRVFEPGKHLLAVTAQMLSGAESDPRRCTAWEELP